MAGILAGMPELRRRFLDEHAPDQLGRCRECRNGSSPEREQCLPYRIASEAQRIADGGAGPGTRVRAHGRSPLATVVRSTVSSTGPNPIRTLKAVPAAAWQPRW